MNKTRPLIVGKIEQKYTKEQIENAQRDLARCSVAIAFLDAFPHLGTEDDFEGRVRRMVRRGETQLDELYLCFCVYDRYVMKQIDKNEAEPHQLLRQKKMRIGMPVIAHMIATGD